MSTLTFILLILWIIILLLGVLIKKHTHQKVKDIESNIVVIQKKNERYDVVATIHKS